jgi:hypothetical protein
LEGAVDELSTRLNEHLADEEQNIVALIGQYVTAEEWQAFIDPGGAYVNPSNLWFALAFGALCCGTRHPTSSGVSLPRCPSHFEWC